MKRPFGVIKNMEEVQKGLIDLTFLPYQQYKGFGGLNITVEIASCGSSGSMLCFTATDADDDVVNTAFQFVPGLFPMFDEVNNRTHLYDETTVSAKGIHKLLEDGDIVYPDMGKLLEEKKTDEESSDDEEDNQEEIADQNVQQMFRGTGIDPLEEDEDDDEDVDEGLTDDPNEIYSSDELRAAKAEGRKPRSIAQVHEEEDEDDTLDKLNIEDEVKEGSNDLPTQDFEELGDDGAEEEQSRSIDEIKELVQRKKNRRNNISYVGVKESALPTENGPTRPQDFDARMAANARNMGNPSKTLDDIRRVEEQRRKDEEADNEMKARFENDRRSKYERKKEFQHKKGPNGGKQNNKRHQNNKERLTLDDLDSIIGSMGLKED